MSKQWFNKSLTSLISALNQQEVKYETIIDEFYKRIEDRDPNIEAWQVLIPKHNYLSQYYAQEDFYQNSLLKGLPFAVKDVIDTEGITTSMGSKIHIDRVPTMDAAVVTAIKNAGGIIIGKTVTTSFAFFNPGKTRNPHDSQRTPGGSSSGSAAAVADFMVPFALGTQTAASVIRPASYCGCFAYVSSHQEFSLRNIQPLAQSLDSLGMFANDFSDLMLMRKVMQLESEFNLFRNNYLPNPIQRVAIYRGDLLGEIHEDMRLALEQYVTKLKNNAVEVIEIPQDLQLQELDFHHKQIMAYEVARNLRFEYQTGQIDTHLNTLIEEGLKIKSENYRHSLNAVSNIRDQFTQWQKSNGIEFTIAPAAPSVAPIGLEKTGLPFMSRPWQAMGLPVTTFPMTYAHKLPLGVQIIGQYRQDDELLIVSKYLFECLNQEFV